MNKLFVGIFCLIAIGCGSAFDNKEQPVVVECYARKCPSTDQIHEAIAVEDHWVPGFEEAILKQQVIVQWYPYCYVFARRPGPTPDNPFMVIGLTPEAGTAEVTSGAVLAHEWMHSYFWITTGDPDSNHEEAPGPWTDNTNNLIEEIKLDLEALDPIFESGTC